VTIDAISALVPRRRTTIKGRIVSVTPRVKPWVRLDVELSDGSGSVILRFLGRGEIPGLTTDRALIVEGTPSGQSGEELVILNPAYSFISCPDH
jgi:hypothetical protein